MKRKTYFKYEYEYRVYSNGRLAGFYRTRKEAEHKLFLCRFDDRYACIQVVCYEYHRNGSCCRIGYGSTCKEAKADLSY